MVKLPYQSRRKLQQCHQLAIQLVGICYAIGWSFIVSYAILQAIDKTIGLRVSEEDEEEGLDSSIKDSFEAVGVAGGQL